MGTLTMEELLEETALEEEILSRIYGSVLDDMLADGELTEDERDLFAPEALRAAR